MYGLHGILTARAGQRDALLAILTRAAENATAMPGCRLYVVSTVPDEPAAVAVTEIWDDRASHDASLALASVRALVAEARPLIAQPGPSSEFHPVAGLAPGGMLALRDDADTGRG